MLTPFDLAYRSISQPSPPKPAREASENAEAAELTRVDVERILHHQRKAEPEELQAIIDNGQHFHLTDSERSELSVQLTVAMAALRARAQGRVDDHGSLMLQKLGYAVTPWGLLANRLFFEQTFKAATAAIQGCNRHHTPKCHCWRDARETLWNIQNHFGARSPEAHVAGRIWESLEELEVAARPEPTLPTSLPTRTLPWSRNSHVDQ
jgi:hypothetical protein